MGTVTWPHLTSHLLLQLMHSEARGGAASTGKITMQQEEVDGAASKLDETNKAESLSPEDIQAVVDATRKRLTKKMRVG